MTTTHQEFNRQFILIAHSRYPDIRPLDLFRSGFKKSVEGIGC
jgi:hypothetical protein